MPTHHDPPISGEEPVPEFGVSIPTSTDFVQGTEHQPEEVITSTIIQRISENDDRENASRFKKEMARRRKPVKKEGTLQKDDLGRCI